mgnify:CR=1 FL=1
MKFDLPSNSLYGNQPITLDLPDDWKIAVHSFQGEKIPGMSYDEIAQILAQKGPNGVPIAQAAKGCKSAVIIVDDISRPTPLEQVAKAILAELNKAGVPKDAIRFVFAVGTHRAMNREEFVRKLGPEIVGEYKIYNHNPFFNTVRVGVTSNGIPIELNADCVQADFKIAVGALFPHPNTGISGGAKTIVPGISSVETIRRYHMQPVKRWDLNTVGRQITLEGANMLGLNAKVDVLLNGKGEITRVFVGNCMENVEKNYEEIKAFFTTPRPEPADLVLLNNYFKPSEPDVSICYPEIFSLVKPGGQLILGANSPLGVAAHYIFGKWGENGVGGLAYSGDRKLPENISRYVIFSEYPERGMGTHYHFDASDPRVRWARTWDEVMENIDPHPKSVLILPYSTVPYFSPSLSVDGGFRLNWNGTSYKQL